MCFDVLHPGGEKSIRSILVIYPKRIRLIHDPHSLEKKKSQEQKITLQKRMLERESDKILKGLMQFIYSCQEVEDSEKILMESQNMFFRSHTHKKIQITRISLNFNHDSSNPATSLECK